MTRHRGPAPEHPEPVTAHRPAAAQAALVASLVRAAPDPPEFGEYRLEATRRARLRKRAGAAAAAWPLLAAALGPDWLPAFTEHARGRDTAGPLREGWDLARDLGARGELGPAAAVELAEREVTLRYDGRGAPRRRRWPAARRAGGVLLLQIGGRVYRHPHG